MIGTTADAGYPMRRWVFDDSAGRYDIDLGDSHVQCGMLRQLEIPADLELGYGSDRGGERLRGLIAGLYGGSPESVLVTHGAQEALYLVYDVLLRPGDRVITFRPGWQQSWDVPARKGCEVTVLDFGPGFTVDADAVEAATGDDVRLIIVNTPCNPTGLQVRRRELVRLAELAVRTDAYLVLDEEYSLDLATSAAVGADRVLSVSGLSKVYGVPGLRVGWLYAPPALAAACAQRKHLTTISNSVLCEALACDVLSRRSAYLDRYRGLTEPGLRQLTEWAEGHAGTLRLVPPDGTPFAWLELTVGEPSMDFCRRVLDTGVLLMPAETLGGHDGVRICFAREPAVLAEGLRRIDLALRNTPQLQLDGAVDR
jgi:aspartate/methionine/tyrosine aminotransferase